MKNDLDHIDEIFKNSLESFEANVDPGVWTNVSQSIGNAVSAGSSASSAIGGGLSKSILFYAAASIVATASIIGSVYLLNDSKPKVEETKVSETVKSLPIQEKENDMVELVNVTNSDSEVNDVENIVEEKVEIDTYTNSQDEKNSNELSDKNKISSSSEDNVNSEIAVSTNEPRQINDELTSETSQQTVNSSKATSTEVKEINISITSNVKKGKAPLDVEFGIDGDGVSYLWNFGDNTTVSSEKMPYHTYKQPGTYKVTLTAIDKDANSKVSYQIIEVEKNMMSSIAEIQNVFSPNGDGLNDVIKVEGENIDKFHAVIMDSKGTLVYEWESIDGFWDGKDNGNNKLTKGVYYLVVTAKGKDGKQHIAKKSIQLY